MRRPVVRFLLVLLGIAVCGWLYVASQAETLDFTNYNRIQNGMSVEEVQAILGAGTEVSQGKIPTVVWAINLSDVEAFRRKTNLTGRSPPSARGDYPTRQKPLVEGDYILQWVNDRTRERILVAFKDGKVCEKNYWDPNYL